MPRQTLCLGALKAIPIVDVQAFCTDCRQPLGEYFWAERIAKDGVWTLSEKEAGARIADLAELGGARVQRPLFKGPRTQPGLYLETFGGRVYLRKRCVCKANQKRTFGAISEMPVELRNDGTVVLMF
jgi:hypothetical protein